MLILYTLMKYKNIFQFHKFLKLKLTKSLLLFLVQNGKINKKLKN